jgi:hypothetical protein
MHAMTEKKSKLQDSFAEVRRSMHLFRDSKAGIAIREALEPFSRSEPAGTDADFLPEPIPPTEAKPITAAASRVAANERDTWRSLAISRELDVQRFLNSIKPCDEERAWRAAENYSKAKIARKRFRERFTWPKNSRGRPRKVK